MSPPILLGIWCCEGELRTGQQAGRLCRWTGVPDVSKDALISNNEFECCISAAQLKLTRNTVTCSWAFTEI
jgi:hypothetical protein